MRKAFPLVLLSGLLSLASISQAMDSFVFKVQPEEQLVSKPGETVGWGYVLQNESRRYWLVTKTLPTDSLDHGDGNPLFDFPKLPPGGKLAVAYDAPNNMGLYQFTWKPTVPPNFVNHGHFKLQAEWWSADPAQGGTLVSKTFEATAPYFVMTPPNQ